MILKEYNKKNKKKKQDSATAVTFSLVYTDSQFKDY